RLVVGEPGQTEARRWLEIDVLVKLRDPFDRPVRHAVLLLQQPAHPMDRGDEKRLDADTAADQVGRLGDALLGIDKYEAVAEAAVKEHRKRADREIMSARHD